MKQFYVIFQTIIIIIAMVSSCLAQEVIVPVNHYPPWRIVKENSQISGINIELMNALLQQTGLKAKYALRPWKRAQWMMKKGSADIMNGLLKYHDREKHMIFLEPPYKTESSKAFYVLKKKKTQIESYDDLYKYRIGVTLGTKFFPKFDHDLRLKKDMAKDASNNFKKLEAGRIDTFILTETVGDYLIHKLGYQDKVEKTQYIYREPLSVYFAVSKRSPLAQRIPELEAALHKMVNTGMVQTIINRYTEDIRP